MSLSEWKEAIQRSNSPEHKRLADQVYAEIGEDVLNRLSPGELLYRLEQLHKKEANIKTEKPDLNEV